MAFFDFHHHHSTYANGLYNHMPENPLPEIPFSVGLHPQYISSDWATQWEAVLALSTHPLCKAIGECGLDGISTVPETIQKEVFLAHIQLANEIQKPIVIHCVKRFYELLPFQKKAKTAMVIHGFNKKESIAKDMLENGFYLSFGSSILQNLSLQSVLQKTPLDKLFLETDDAKVDIEEIYNKAAMLKGITVEQFINSIEENKTAIGIL